MNKFITLSGVALLFTGLLAFSGSAHADTIAITTTTSYTGSVSGTISGSGSTVSGFLITLTPPASKPITLSSTDAGSSSSFSSAPFTDFFGVTINFITLQDSSGDNFVLPVFGNFTTGLSYAGNQGAYTGYDGDSLGFISPAQSTNIDEFLTTSVDVSLSVAQGDSGPTPVPEPSSFLLAGTGLAGLWGSARKSLRRR